MNPRKPTEEEKKELVDYLLTHDYEDGEGVREIVEGKVARAAIAVFDDYVTRSQERRPGYAGKIMVVVYDGAPFQSETYSWNTYKHEKMLRECGIS